MEFTYVVSNTIKQYLKHQGQVSRKAYPLWVTVCSYGLIFGGTAFLTFALFLIFDFAIRAFLPFDSFALAIIPAGLLAWNLMVLFNAKIGTPFFLKYARFELDFEFTSRKTISEQGLVFDEGDRRTHIAWSAIGGVFQTQDFIVFYCRGLFYNVPLEQVGDEEAQNLLLEQCKAWQSDGQCHKTAKAFL